MKMNSNNERKTHEIEATSNQIVLVSLRGSNKNNYTFVRNKKTKTNFGSVYIVM